MLNNIGWPGLAFILGMIVILFGQGKISSLMGEVGQGLTAFRRGLRQSPDVDQEP